MQAKQIILTCLIVVSTLYKGYGQEFYSMNYDRDDSDFPNPERGLYHHLEVRSTNYSLLQKSTLESYRAEGISLVMRVFYLENFVTSDISYKYLNQMREDFATARAAGVKLLVRFAYTKRTGAPYGDATPEQALKHIDQLADVLFENSDVIALVQAGFIGAWGEWFYTDHFSQVVGFNNEQNWKDRSALVSALLDILPIDRTVQLRTPVYKRKITGINAALNEEKAFSGSAQSRLGHHNDCFLASPNDVGTYVDPIEEKQYISQEAMYVPLGGETCGVYVPRSECPSALAELKQLHWSYLNVDYHPVVIQGFETNNCLDSIKKTLGYRLRLIDSRSQVQAKPGGELLLESAFLNEGWANAFNPRLVEVVLVNRGTDQEYYFQLDEDIRKWSLTDTIRISETIGLPAEMPEGMYDMFINFPDPRETLYSNPAYAIRLANSGIWNAQRGYNDLKVTVHVSSSFNFPLYEGSNKFKQRGVMDVDQSISPIFCSSSSTQALVYWGSQDAEAFRVIERSADNGNTYETLAIIPSQKNYFIDRSITPGAGYKYRSYFRKDNVISGYSTADSIMVPNSTPDYYTFDPDGSIEEWAIVEPVATLYHDSLTYALRLFADRDSLNVLIQGTVSAEIFLDSDNNSNSGNMDPRWKTSGFDYMIRGDSLFKYISNRWEFDLKLHPEDHSSGVEVSLPNSQLEMAENTIIKTACVIHLESNEFILMPGDSTTARYIRQLPASTPATIQVTNSQSAPTSRLVVEWDNTCYNCDGFVVERSEDVSTGFLEVFRTASEKIYRDDGLQPDKQYFYRVYSYNATGRSLPSVVVDGRTAGNITAVESGYFEDSDLEVFPNPTQNVIFLKSKSAVAVSNIKIVNALGLEISNERYTVVRLPDEIHIGLNGLSPGLYFILIERAGNIRPVKIIKN